MENDKSGIPLEKTESKPEQKPEEKKKGLLGGKFFTKVKTIKHIEIIIIVIFAAVLLLVVFGLPGGCSLGGGSDTTTGSTSLEEYQKKMEKQLSDTLSRIDGAGKVSVMITFETGSEQVIAYSTDKTTNSTTENGRTTSSTTERSQIVMVGGKPVVLYEVQPKIKGVLVVAEGAGNVSVEIKIKTAVSTILNIEPRFIEIFSASK